MKYYVYRTTTDKLADGLEHIESSGDGVVQIQFTGGRDWIIIATKGVGGSVGQGPAEDARRG